MPRQTRRTLEVEEEIQLGTFGTLRLAVAVDYTVEAYRPAVINADPDDCHPAEGGVCDVDEMRCRSIVLVMDGDDVGLAWELDGDKVTERTIAAAAVAWWFDENGGDNGVRELCERHEEYEGMRG